MKKSRRCWGQGALWDIPEAGDVEVVGQAVQFLCRQPQLL